MQIIRRAAGRHGGARRRFRSWHPRSLAALIGSISVLSTVAIVVVGCARGGTYDVLGAPRAQATAPATTTATASSVRTVLDQYCVTCHNESMVSATGEPTSLLVSKLRATGLAFDVLDVTRPSDNLEAWEAAITKLRAGTMPPGGSPRPDEATYHAVASWLENEIDRVASASPNPGRNSSVHRLNRTEYTNAIRDLFVLEIDGDALLPGDETSDTGFDNNADVLSITTSQLERYLSAARKITRLAIGLPPAAGFVRFENSVLLTQSDRQSEELPLGSRGGIASRYDFPADGEYRFRIQLQSNWQDYIRGMGRRHELDLRIDGEIVRRFTVGGEAPPGAAPTSFSPGEIGSPEWEEYVREADSELDIRVPVKGGPHVVGVSFVRSMSETEGILQPQMVGELLSNDEMFHGDARVQAVEIEGPYDGAIPEDTPSRQKVFDCYPTDASEEGACATRILSRLARLAYRRPVTDQDLRTLLAFFEDGRERGGGFDTGIQLALERLLVDPAFLLRVQEDPPGAVPGQPYRLSEIELATRLSFFLWSSIPDEPLLDAAERRELSDPAILDQQVTRMLADPRAESLVSNFAAQWLHLRNLSDVKGEPAIFPNFDQDLVESFRQETELFIASTIKEDRSVLDLLRADYSFINERLARHYGIPGIYGSRFRRVTLPNTDERGGLLAHGSVLSLTSYPNRTSPVLRGKWLLEAIFGAPPPGPPPNVPELPERGEGGEITSVRERLEQHRRNPVCASCHENIDPPGFALESYDALGAFRTLDEGGRPVDNIGVMPNGVTIDGLPGLRSLLLDKPERFVGTLTERLLAYALGRQLDYYDRPSVREIVRNAAADDYRWSSLIRGVVGSPTFQMRMAAE